MALTVDEALAALASAYDNYGGLRVWCIQAFLTITDAVGTISGQPGRLYGGAHPLASPTALLSGLNPYGGFLVHRGEWTGVEPEFLIGMDIEAVVAIAGPLTMRPPAFARSFMQRHGLLSRTHYRGVLAADYRGSGMWLSFEGQPRFAFALTEDSINPKLTGTITQYPYGGIVPPATIEVVLDSLMELTGP